MNTTRAGQRTGFMYVHERIANSDTTRQRFLSMEKWEALNTKDVIGANGPHDEKWVLDFVKKYPEVTVEH